MRFDNEFSIRLSNLIPDRNIERDVLMKQYTSFKVGGPVDIFITPDDYMQIVQAIGLCKEYGIKYYIMGNGSNLLVKDGGIRGVVIKLSKLNKITVEGERVTAESGAFHCRLLQEKHWKTVLQGLNLPVVYRGV